MPEQNGILDWLRRLRLHKYYPVFKQLTMEEVGADLDDIMFYVHTFIITVSFSTCTHNHVLHVHLNFAPLQFLALTEEDLNKYDLTQGAKKKLKTQLELQKSAE